MKSKISLSIDNRTQDSERTEKKNAFLLKSCTLHVDLIIFCRFLFFINILYTNDLYSLIFKCRVIAILDIMRYQKKIQLWQRVSLIFHWNYIWFYFLFVIFSFFLFCFLFINIHYSVLGKTDYLNLISRNNHNAFRRKGTDK